MEALQKTDYVEYLADMLLYGEKEEKEKIIKELGKEVRQLEKRLSELNAK